MTHPHTEAQRLGEQIKAALGFLPGDWSIVAQRALADQLVALASAQPAEPAPAERFFAFEFEVWQDGEMQASASGTRDQALAEAMHYAAQYAQDGPVKVFEVVRTLVAAIHTSEKPA